MPVLPEVNRIAAISSGRVASSTAPLPRRPCASNCPVSVPPQPKRGPAVTSFRIESGAQRISTLARCARVTPIKASGAASPRQCFSGLRPMPGSMRTGTAPVLNRAKNRAKNSSPGGTIRAVRVPRQMP